jgi:hypothetical protein
MSFSKMFLKLSPFKNFEKFTLDLSEKNCYSSQCVESLYTRPTSVSDFLLLEYNGFARAADPALG